jgi:cell division protease FtsH
MITKYGMSEKLGPISFDSSDHSIFIGRDFGTTKSYSEETAALIDEEVKRIFDDASAACEKILNEHAEQVKGVAEYLLRNESMEAEDFHSYIDKGILPPDKPEEPEADAEATVAPGGEEDTPSDD